MHTSRPKKRKREDSNDVAQAPSHIPVTATLARTASLATASATNLSESKNSHTKALQAMRTFADIKPLDVAQQDVVVGATATEVSTASSSTSVDKITTPPLVVYDPNERITISLPLDANEFALIPQVDTEADTQLHDNFMDDEDQTKAQLAFDEIVTRSQLEKWTQFRCRLEFKLSRARFSKKGIDALSVAFNQHYVEYADFSFSTILYAENILRSVAHHEHLLHLNLSSSYLMPARITRLLTPLSESTSILSLGLRDSIMREGDDAKETSAMFNALGTLLRQNRSLTKLDISQNRIISREMDPIIEGLSANDTLKELDVSCNKMGSRAFCRMLGSMHVASLSARDAIEVIPKNDSVTKAIIEEMKRVESPLTALDISDFADNLNSEAMILQALADNKTLTSFSMSPNKYSRNLDSSTKDYVNALSTVLIRNSTLTSLTSSAPSLDGVAKMLPRSIQYNKTLRFFECKAINSYYAGKNEIDAKLLANRSLFESKKQQSKDWRRLALLIACVRANNERGSIATSILKIIPAILDYARDELTIPVPAPAKVPPRHVMYCRGP